MKYTPLFLTLVFLFLSCDTQQLAKIQEENRIVSDERSDRYLLKEIRTIEFDSCEYLTSGSFHNRTLTHKGNCKFCEQRKTK